MPQTGPDRPPGTRFPRRVVLTGALAVGVVPLGGCSLVDPQVGDPTPRPANRVPTPSPTPPLPGVTDALRRERKLLKQARSIQDASNAPDSDSARGRLVAAMVIGHGWHVAALASGEPTARPTTEASGSTPSASASPTASPTRGRVDASEVLGAMAKDQRKAATAYREVSLASEGPTALLWASLATAAATYADAIDVDQGDADRAGDTGTPKPVSPTPKPQETVTAVAATQAMVTQLHAVVYGYQLAIGHLSGSTRDDATETLRAHRVLRDTLVARLIEAKQDVPVSAPAYVPPVKATDADSATTLIRRIESALLPWPGLWVAAATDADDRKLAVATLTTTALDSVRWGGALRPWPGWTS